MLSVYYFRLVIIVISTIHSYTKHLYMCGSHGFNSHVCTMHWYSEVGQDRITLFPHTLPYTIGVQQCRGTLFVPYSIIGNQQCGHTKGLL